MRTLFELTDDELVQLAEAMLPTTGFDRFIRPYSIPGRSLEQVFMFFFDRGQKGVMGTDPFYVQLYSNYDERPNVGAMVRYLQSIGVELP